MASTELTEILDRHVRTGPLPGAVALVAHADRQEVAVVGHTDAEGTRPLARDAIFRIASLTKPVIAAATMTLVDDGLLGLDEPVGRLLPELAEPVVVRDPAGPVDDVVPASRPLTPTDLLTFRAGHGFPADFTLPAVAPLLELLRQGPPQPGKVPDPATWMAALARIPLLHQPGDTWLYNTGADILGVLVARASGQPLPEFLAERLFAPLGMPDTGFHVPRGKLHRFTSLYAPDGEGGARLVDAPDGQWSSPPAFPSGAAGLVSTVDDYHAFARMLLADGTAGGRRLLSAASVRRMTTNHLTRAQRDAATLFLSGQGWGYGGSVDVESFDPWNTPGRYGWVGGTGTTAHISPLTGTVTILLSQVQMTGPVPPPLMRDFWRHAAGA
ncbi:serine hydrolase domain-containing protein [Streptomyces sp. NPDC050560]|uniref:serine hydrolase domain-containing protein n=1 Tax=Streptomyces sp. NPDC050560 TaxID=3365630 RepID=UPI0037991D09